MTKTTRRILGLILTTQALVSIFAMSTISASATEIKNNNSQIVEKSNVDTIESPTTQFIPGDANNDGRISVVDGVLIQKHVLGLKTLNKQQCIVCDLNHDGKVNSSDLILVMRKILGYRYID